MNAPSSPLTATLGRGLRRTLGVLMTAFFLAAMLVTGAEIGAEGGWWVALALGTSLWLLLAAVGNWRILWTAMGQVLRVLLGERGARIAFGLMAIAFALGALSASVAAPSDETVVAHATSTDR